MNNMFSFLCNDDLDMAFVSHYFMCAMPNKSFRIRDNSCFLMVYLFCLQAVAMNLYVAGFVVRVICGFKAVPKVC